MERKESAQRASTGDPGSARQPDRARTSDPDAYAAVMAYLDRHRESSGDALAAWLTQLTSDARCLQRGELS